MFYIIYKTTNKTNGKFYIGCHKTADLDDNYLGSGKLLRRAIAKHGVGNFKREILHLFETPEEMFAKEAEIVTEELLANDLCYNLNVGGFGGFDYINKTPSLLSEKRLAALNKGGVFGTPESRSEMMREIHRKGIGSKNFKDPTFQKLMSDRARNVKRQFQSDHQKGSKNSQFGSFWITDGKLNKKIRGEIPEGWNRGRTIQREFQR